MLPLKHAIAGLIRNPESPDQILAIRRPDDDDELPGIWGLPAGSRRGIEELEDIIARIGRDKLGVILKPLRKLNSGTQDRPGYRLEMELWEVAMEGTPSHSEWKWAGVDWLRPGADLGSLCCQLAGELRGPVPEVPPKREGRVS